MIWKKKIMKLYFVVVCLIAIIGCAPTSRYFINFNSNGGTIVAPISTDGKSIVSLPNNPTKDDYLFEGWYYDNNTFTQEFSLNSLVETPISSDLTVYAKWVNSLENVYLDLMSQSSSNPITISFWHGFRSKATLAVESAVADFEDRYPMIDVEIRPYGNFDTLRSALLPEIVMGTIPNLILGYPEHIAQYLTTNVIPLDSYLNCPNENIGVDPMDYPSIYMAENRQYVQGVTYGIPFHQTVEVLIYNKTFFDAHGLIVPETWDQVRSVAQQIINIVYAVIAQTPDMNGKKIDAISGLDFTNVTYQSFYPMSYDSQANLFITAIRQWGGTYTELGDDYSQGYIRFDTAIAREALSFFRTMYYDHLFAPPESWKMENHVIYPFKALKTMMDVTSSDYVNYYVPEEENYELGVAPIPYKTASKATVMHRGTNFALLNTGTDLEKLATWLLIRYLSGERNMEFAMDSSFLPVRKSDTESETYQSFLNTTTGTPFDLSEVHSAIVSSSYFADNSIVQWEIYTDPGFLEAWRLRKRIATIIPGITYHSNTIDYQLQQVLAEFTNNIE